MYHTPADLHLPRGQDCPLMTSWKCPKIRGKTKPHLDLNKVLRTCHVKIFGYLHRI